MPNPRFDHLGDGTYERSGECCRCGECCMTGDPFEGALGEPVIAGACPLLRQEPDGLYSCTDRTNPYYLNGPNVWPTHPEQIVNYPSCTYSFKKVA